MSPEKGTLVTIRLFFCGIFMGVAEIIPGISGGTVAFIMGIYQPFLDGIKSLDFRVLKLLLTGRWAEAAHRVPWRFLLPLFLGTIVSFVVLAKVFAFMLGHEVYRVYLFALFLGLILASTVYCGRKVRPWQGQHIALFLICALCSYLLTSAGSKKEIGRQNFAVFIPQAQVRVIGEVDNYDSDNELLQGVNAATLNAMIAKKIITPQTRVYHYASDRYGMASEFADGYIYSGFDPYLLFCGMVSVSAMLLPGVSGSYLMTVMGAYPTVIGSLADFLDGLRSFTVNGEALWVLFSVGMGIIVGGLTFARVVSFLIRRYASLTIAALTGFMVGSLRCLWPFWSYGYHLEPLRLDQGPKLGVISPILPDTGSSVFFVAMTLVLIGFFAIISVEFFAKDN